MWDVLVALSGLWSFLGRLAAGIKFVYLFYVVIHILGAVRCLLEHHFHSILHDPGVRIL